MKIIETDVLLDKLSKIENEKDFERFIKKYKDLPMLDSILTNYAEDLANGKNHAKGIMMLEHLLVSKALPYISDETTIYLALAKHYIEYGNISKGKEFLIKIANETVDNYEDAIEFRGYTSFWNEHKHLIQKEIKPSTSSNGNTDLTDDELLDLLLEEVHSGGYDAYLSYNNEHFEDTLKAAKRKGINSLVEQMERIKAMFPKGKIPANVIDSIEENNLNFDDEDELFYTKICLDIEAK